MISYSRLAEIARPEDPSPARNEAMAIAQELIAWRAKDCAATHRKRRHGDGCAVDGCANFRPPAPQSMTVEDAEKLKAMARKCKMPASWAQDIIDDGYTLSEVLRSLLSDGCTRCGM